jgi:hypothetical protein
LTRHVVGYGNACKMVKSLLQKSDIGDLVRDHILDVPHWGELDEGVEQTWGQLMGSPISFIVLCILNAAVCRSEIERSLGRRFTLWNCPLRVNGDDAVFRLKSIDYGHWRESTNLCGLEVSPGKNVVSCTTATINSEMYRTSRVVDWFGVPRLAVHYEPYINMGLVFGQSRVLSSGRDDPFGKTSNHEFRGDDSLGAKAHALILGHDRALADRLLGKFIQRNGELLRQAPATGQGSAENARQGAAGLVKSGKAITGNVTMQTAENMVNGAYASQPALAVA